MDGDVLLMMSDGVLTGGIEWVEESLGAIDPASVNMKTLAEQIAADARKRQEDREDDVTVIALRIARTN